MSHKKDARLIWVNRTICNTTVEILIRRHVLWRLIWVCPDCLQVKCRIVALKSFLARGPMCFVIQTHLFGHLSYLSTGSTQEDPSLYNWKIVNGTNRIKSNKETNIFLVQMYEMRSASVGECSTWDWEIQVRAQGGSRISLERGSICMKVWRFALLTLSTLSYNYFIFKGYLKTVGGEGVRSGSALWDSPEALCCVIEQDTLTFALYSFNTGHIQTWLKIVDSDVKRFEKCILWC